MPSFHLNFECNGAAFSHEVAARDEIVRILQHVAEHVMSWKGIKNFQPVYDINGNKVGQFKLVATPEE